MARQMKDSGVEWIGEIPEDWNCVKIKQLANRDVENSFTDGDWIESPYIDNKGIRYLTTGNIGDGVYKDQGSGYISVETFKMLNCKYAYPDDLVFSRLNAPYGRSCILPNDFERYVLAVDNVILRPMDNVVKPYICFFTQCKGYQDSVFDYSKGTTMKRISRSNLGNIPVLLPSKNEQQKIAEFLDQKVGEIDSVVARTKETIEDYKRYKQAIITDAVTKGLNPDVEMKDSGIKWIGNIPKKWSCMKLRHVVEKIGDIDHYMPEMQLQGIPYVMTGDLQDLTSKIDFEKCKKVSYEIFQELSSKMRANRGDVILARYATIGTVSYVDIDKEFLVSYSCVTIKPTMFLKGKFLFYYTKTTPFIEELKKYTNSNTQGNVGIDSLYQAKIILPPVEEQKKIISYLDEKCSEIDKLIVQKEKLLADLEYYKKSIIYEYVTGKEEIH